MYILRNLALTVTLTLSANAGFGQSVPANFNLQGRLNTSAGAPVTGTVDMTFSLWDAPLNGTKVWQEPATGTVPVAVANGIFNYRLGSTVGIPASLFGATGDHYVGITVNGESLTPRQPLSSVASSMQSQNSYQATNATALGGLPAANWQQLITPSACPVGQYLSVVNPNGTTTCSTPPGVTLGGVLELDGYVNLSNTEIGPTACPAGWTGAGGKMRYKVTDVNWGASAGLQFEFVENYRLVCFRSDANYQVIYLTGFQDVGGFPGQGSAIPPSCPAGWTDAGTYAKYQGVYKTGGDFHYLVTRTCYRAL